MRVGIVGSRDYPRLDLVAACVGRLARWGADHGEPVIIVSGTEPRPGKKYGVDEIAVSKARELGLGVVIHEADWRTHGKRAGPLRNTDIVNESEYVVAFWDLKSRGTADSINKSLMRGNLRVVRGPDGKPLGFDAVGELLRRTLGS